MILEKKEDVVWMLWVLNMALRINKPHLHTHIGTTKAHLRIGHVSTAAVFSEYGSCEWLIRETYKKAGCLRMGAKLLQFFDTPKFFVTILWTHDIFSSFNGSTCCFLSL